MSDKMRRWLDDFAQDLRRQGNKVYLIAALATVFAWCIYPTRTTRVETEKANVIAETPYDGIRFGQGEMAVERAEILSETSYSGYGYSPVVEVEYDLSKLSDKDKYWLSKSGSLTASCVVSSETNGVSDKVLIPYSIGIDGSKLTLRFMSEDETEEWKWPFDDAVATVGFTVVRDETTDVRKRDGTTVKIHETDSYVIPLLANEPKRA